MEKTAIAQTMRFPGLIILLFLTRLLVLEADAQETTEYEIETIEGIIGTGEGGCDFLCGVTIGWVANKNLPIFLFSLQSA